MEPTPKFALKKQLQVIRGNQRLINTQRTVFCHIDISASLIFHLMRSLELSISICWSSHTTKRETSACCVKRQDKAVSTFRVDDVYMGESCTGDKGVNTETKLFPNKLYRPVMTIFYFECHQVS